MKKLNIGVLLVVAIFMQLQLVAQQPVSQFVNLTIPISETPFHTKVKVHRLFGQLECLNSDVLNSDQKDFSPVYYEQGIVFPSTRKIRQRHNKDQVQTKYYYARINSKGNIRAVRSFDSALKNFEVEGPVCFSPSGKTLFFAQRRGTNINGLPIYHLQLLGKKKGMWRKQRQLPVNQNGYTSQHPHLSKDAKRLFFSSNQPGGYGGMDIYVTYYDDGYWSDPINLGPEVNSTADELYPTLADDGRLYFTSSKAGGMGGLDLYTAREKRDSEVNLFDEVENLGEPFNSRFDDFGFIMNPQKTGGYFSSNRPGGKGDFDIYSWDVIKGLDPNQIVNYNIKPAKNRVEKEVKVEKPIANEDFINNITKNVLVRPAPQIPAIEELPAMEKHLRAVAEKREKRSFEAGQQITLSNVESVEQLNEFSHSELRFLLNMLRDHPELEINFILQNSKNDLTFVKKYLTNNGISSDRLKIKRESLEKKYYGDPHHGMTIEISKIDEKVNKTPATPKKEPSKTKTTPAKTSYEDIVTEKLFMGRGTKLSKVHYGYNEHQLDEASKKEIDGIVSLMKEHDSLEIGLFGHTDSFGGNAYNLQLSQKRAESVKAYMVAQGISPSRLKIKAFGEGQLIYNCEKQADCSKDKQRINRRTEMIILNIDQQELEKI